MLKSLEGLWRLKERTGRTDIPMRVPGDVHSALLDAQRISDPFIGRQELDMQWVGRSDWLISTTFTLTRQEIRCSPRWILEIDSLDTVAGIFVNGSPAAESTSMFIPVREDVTGMLLEGDNLLEIRLSSPETAASARAESLPYPVPHQVYPHQSMHRNLLRKTQAHGSWDWGIAMMVSGVYGGIRLRGTGKAALAAAWTTPRPVQEGSGTWTVPVYLEWDLPGIKPGECGYPEQQPEITADLLAPDGSRSASSSSAAAEVLKPGLMRIDLAVHDPELWWPAGYGKQPLYTLRITMESDTRDIITAFRTVETVSRKDEIGASFYLRVNNRDIWAKGANWIPADAFPSRQTPELLEELLTDLRDAHMNMIRVWGGGQYEPEEFYSTCDRLGILIWQDFMFACSLYPSEQWFLDEVRSEVQAQVKRLSSHPSIALWCGNNENVGALGWFEESREHPGRYLIDYDRLNTGVIARELHALDDTRTFWPSSPAAGVGDFTDNWHDDSSGDMHFWSVWHEGKPFSAYYEVTPRFCSEFGFQSFPSLATVRSFAGEDQLNPTSPELEHHQRNERGNTVILETISHYFRFPFDFSDFIYLSQVQQAMAISTAVLYWRSRRPVSMGALYWQLNDLWPVVSWSSIEYSGMWKILHYEARRFFAPLKTAAFLKDGEIEVHLLNDTENTIGGELRLTGFRWDGRKFWEISLPAAALHDSAVEVWRKPLPELPFGPGEGFLLAEFKPSGQQYEADSAADAAYPGWRNPDTLRCPVLLTEFKQAPLIRPEVSLTESGGFVEIAVSRAPAFWLTLEMEYSGNSRYRGAEDNGLFMLPGEKRSVRIGSEATVRSVRSIAHTY